MVTGEYVYVATVDHKIYKPQTSVRTIQRGIITPLYKTNDPRVDSRLMVTNIMHSNIYHNINTMSMYKTPPPGRALTEPPSACPTDPTPPFHIPMNYVTRGTESAKRSDVAEVLARVGDETIFLDEISEDVLAEFVEFQGLMKGKLNNMLHYLVTRESLKEGKQLKKSVQDIIGCVDMMGNMIETLRTQAGEALDHKITKAQKNKRFSGQLKAKYEGVKDWY